MLERLASVNYIALDKVNPEFIDCYLSLSSSYTNYEHICFHVYMSVMGSGYIDTKWKKIDQQYTFRQEPSLVENQLSLP